MTCRRPAICYGWETWDCTLIFHIQKLQMIQNGYITMAAIYTKTINNFVYVSFTMFKLDEYLRLLATNSYEKMKKQHNELTFKCQTF
jgi:hypothetical protein